MKVKLNEIHQKILSQHLVYLSQVFQIALLANFYGNFYISLANVAYCVCQFVDVLVESMERNVQFFSVCGIFFTPALSRNKMLFNLVPHWFYLKMLFLETWSDHLKQNNR